MMRMSMRRSFVAPTPEEAESYNYSPTEQQIMETWNAKIMSGTGEQVVAQLNAWQARVNADELIADAYGMPEDMTGAIRNVQA